MIYKREKNWLSQKAGKNRHVACSNLIPNLSPLFLKIPTSSFHQNHSYDEIK